MANPSEFPVVTLTMILRLAPFFSYIPQAQSTAARVLILKVCCDCHRSKPLTSNSDRLLRAASQRKPPHEPWGSYARLWCPTRLDEITCPCRPHLRRSPDTFINR